MTILGMGLFACEGTGPPDSGGSSRAQTTTGTVRVEPGSHGNSSALTVDPLLPPGSADRPAKPGQLGRDRAEDGMPILTPKGPNLEQLFAQPERDTDARIKRVENAVIEIRRDLDAAIPAINRLIAIEGDIQSLVTQLRTLLNEDERGASGDISLAPPPPPDGTQGLVDTVQQENLGTIEPIAPEQLAPPSLPAGQKLDEAIEPPASSPTPAVVPLATPEPSKPKPVEKPAVTPPSKESQKPESTKTNLSSVRTGDHADKTRIVLDVPKNVKATTDLDNDEKVLIVEMPGVDVEAGRQTVTGSKLVDAMELQADADGSRAVFELKKGTLVKNVTVLPPAGENKMHRLVIDLAP